MSALWERVDQWTNRLPVPGGWIYEIRHTEAMVSAIFVPAPPEYLATEIAERETAQAERDALRDNILALLNSDDSAVVRVHEGGGPEDISLSIAVTFAKVKDQRDTMQKALKQYADQLCEGWCETGGEGRFTDCGGCPAKAALLGLGWAAPSAADATPAVAPAEAARIEAGAEVLALRSALGPALELLDVCWGHDPGANLRHRWGSQPHIHAGKVRDALRAALAQAPSQAGKSTP